MERSRNFLYILAVMIVVFLYYTVLVPKIVPKLQPRPSHTAAPSPSKSDDSSITAASPTPAPSARPSASPAPTPVPTPAPSATPRPEPKRLKVSSPLIEMGFTSEGAAVTSCVFRIPPPELRKKGYRPYYAPDAPKKEPMPLLAVLREGHTSYRLMFNKSSDPEDLSSLADDDTVYEVKQEGPLSVVFTGRRGDLLIEKRYTLSPNSYDVRLEVRFTNTGSQPVRLSYALLAPAGVVPEGIENLRGTLAFNTATLAKGSRLHAIDDYPARKLPEDGSFQIFRPVEDGEIDWIAVTSHFFGLFLDPDRNVPVIAAFARTFAPQPALARRLPTYNAAMKNIEAGVVMKPIDLEPGGNVAHKFFSLPAPKYGKILSRYEGREYVRVVKLGFFGMVARLILYLLEAINFVVGNYGLAIIILTILIQLALHPLTKKQYESMFKMQKLQPFIKEAQKRFKKDQKKLGEVTMAIYQHTGVNPLGGCLPMLVQLPIFFALYSAFYSCIELRQASFLWIHDLSGPERLPLGTALPLLGNTINILPFLMTAVWFIQQSTTPKPTDPNQQATHRIMKFLPFVFFFLFYNLPSGLVLYWFVRNLVYIVETLRIKAELRRKEESGELNFSRITLDQILRELKQTAKKRMRKP